MKKFLLRLSIYFTLLFSIYISYFILAYNVLNTNSLYRLPASKPILVIGDSHTADAVNDSIVTDVVNVSNPADAYLYSYRKLQKILPLNPHIKTVVIGVGSHNIQKFMENEFIYNSGYTPEKIRNYFQILTLADFKFFFLKLPGQLIKGFAAVPKIKTITLKDIIFSPSSTNYIDINLGKYNYLNTPIDMDFNKKRIQKRIKNKEDLLANSDWQIQYLGMMVQICRQHNTQVVFLRTPEHPLFPKQNEPIFKAFLKNNYADIPFIDLIDLPLNDSCFYDMDHMNCYGAAKVSDTLKYYLRKYN